MAKRIRFNDCDYELNRKTFDDILREEKYRIAKETQAGKENYCHCCLYMDETKGECLCDLTTRVKMGNCYKAKGIYNLKKEGLYGQTRNF